jgi:hypothetical protein
MRGRGIVAKGSDRKRDDSEETRSLKSDLFNCRTMQRQESALFDAISANTKTHGVFVPEDQLDGYKELWIRQLEQFTLVSRDVAVTIASLYPSPRLLLKAYDDCATQRQKEQLVENVVVRRGTDRRVGPKMSKMLFNFICSLDGSEFLE